MVCEINYLSLCQNENIMKKLVLVLAALVLLIGCSQKGQKDQTVHSSVYHTYFGDIDIDTMEIAFYDLKDSLPCYLVHVADIDSVEKVPGEWGYIYGPIRNYYCPEKNIYFYSFPDNHGDEILRGYDPYTNEYYKPDER